MVEYNRLHMKRQEFTDGERFFLDSHNFQLYDDPVLQSIKSWETGSDQWHRGVLQVHQASSTDIFALREAELDISQNNYAEAFAEAATAVATVSGAPERIIPALSGLIRAEDARRREQLRYIHIHTTATEPSEEYVYDLAMAFGDPQGLTLSPDSSYVIFDQSTATEYFTSRLAEHASLILDTRREAYQRLVAMQTKRGLGSVATRIIKRFKNR